MNYLQVTFENLQEGDADILTALLWEAGYEGFSETENCLMAFITEAGFDENKLEKIGELVPLSYTKTLIPPQNWNAQWESSFEPVQVNDFAAIRASFHHPVASVKHEIIITPKMSFGTGHHATTFLMMEQMSGLDLTGKTILDFGTGTGVLAILAEKMGASSIVGIDNDDWSIENAAENIAANNCSKIILEKGSSITGERKFDIILANINLNVILDSLPQIVAVARPGAYILLSGFLETDTQAIQDALISHNLVNDAQIKAKNGWICLLTSC